LRRSGETPVLAFVVALAFLVVIPEEPALSEVEWESASALAVACSTGLEVGFSPLSQPAKHPGFSPGFFAQTTPNPSS